MDILPASLGSSTPSLLRQFEVGTLGHALATLSPLHLPETLDQLAEAMRVALGAARVEIAQGAGGENCTVVSRGPQSDDGKQSRLCVPLMVGEECIGSMLATWNEPCPPQRALDLLRWAGPAVEMAMMAEETALRRGLVHSLKHHGAELESFLEIALERMVQCGRARSGTLVLFGQGGPGSLLCQVSSATGGPDCPLFSEECEPCPLLKGERAFTVASAEAPGESYRCRGIKENTIFLYGLPLVDNSAIRGAVMLDYADVPQPVSRYLACLTTLSTVLMTELKQRWPDLWNKVVPLRGLRIRCFGRFGLWLGGQRVPAERFRRTQSLTLLKILIEREGQPISRDALCDLLWPDADPGLSANRLHVVVHDLRQGLRPAETTGCIQNDQGQYRLQLGPEQWVDLYRFRELVESGRQANAQGRIAEATAALEEAASLYRGDLFADEPRSDWCLSQREHVRETYLWVLKSLGKLRAESGDLARGLDHLRRAVELDALREDLHQDLMELYLRMGRRKEALQQYERCAAVVREELRCEPATAIQQLYQRILQSL